MKNTDIFGAKFDVLRHYTNTDFDTVRVKCLFVFHRFFSTETCTFPPTQQFHITHQEIRFLLFGVDAVNRLIRMSHCSIKYVVLP
jgi:hypothetical protein